MPKLVFHGTRDEQAPIVALEAVYPASAEPKTLIRIEGATHFFDRQIAALGDALRSALVAGG